MQLFSSRSSKSKQKFDAGASPSGMLSELSCNSPTGPMKLGKGIRKGLKGSPAQRKSSRLLSSMSSSRSYHDADPLLTPGRKVSDCFVADKHVIVRKPNNDFEKLGITFRTDASTCNMGVLISGLEPGGAGASSSLLVGDVVLSIDGVAVKTAEEAVRHCGGARPGASLYIAAMGGTREVVLDKRRGDCGMTCAGAGFIARGVLLKRIASGSLADAEKLYCGDTILSINGVLVNHHAECVKAIDAVPDIVRLVVLGESQEVSLPASAERLGLTLRNHDGPEDGAGVKVLAVDPEGRCAAAGLTAGDTLLSVNNQLLTDHEQAMTLLKALSSGSAPSTSNNPFDPASERPSKPAELKLVIQSKYSAK